MEKNKIVVANHKMNLSALEIGEYLNAISSINNKKFIVCPTNIYLPYFLKHGYGVGIQNVHHLDSGAFTGEVSSKQASSLGINYALIGHSERRAYFKETDEVINLKIKNALLHNIKPILCIGEIKRGRHNEKILKEELIHDLKDVADLGSIIIAYEPVWAIGTSLTPTNDEIIKTVSFIKEFVKKQFKYNDIKVLYGGSVNENNIELLNQIEIIDGYLVGGASINIEKIKKIIEVVL